MHLITALPLSKILAVIFFVYSFSDSTTDIGIADLLSKGLTFVPARRPNLAKTLMDVKLYLRKLNFRIMLGENNDKPDNFYILSTFNPLLP